MSILNVFRSSRNGTRSEGPRDSGRTVFFPVGTDRPARRRPAALDRPGLTRPFLPGRLPVRISAFTWNTVVYQLYAVVTFSHERSCLSSLFSLRKLQVLCGLRRRLVEKSSCLRSKLSHQILFDILVDIPARNFECLSFYHIPRP